MPSVALPRHALPGTSLAPLTALLPGPGTHIHNGALHASLSGVVTTSAAAASAGNIGGTGNGSGNAKSTAVVTPARMRTRTRTVLPAVDGVVLARVTRLSQRQATVAILAVRTASGGGGGGGGGGEGGGDGSSWAVCAEGAAFQGLIRVQDVRATEKDKVRVLESFRPGDVVRAVVISLGDQSAYYLSTASNALGVVMATSEAGNAMVPLSWCEFRDPVTGATERRKVAKPE